MNLNSACRSLLLALLATALTTALVFAQAGTLPPPQTDLLVTKSGPAEAAAGSDVTYIITIENLGPDDGLNVALSDPLPAGMTFVSKAADPAGFTCVTPAVGAGGTITCTAATLPGLATATFTFVFNIPAATPLGTTFVNIATITSDNDFNAENDSAVAATSTPAAPQADMGVIKTGPAAAGPDTDVVYTIVVANGGPDAAANAALSDTLPGTMTFVSLTQTGTAMTCITPAPGAGGTVTCTALSYPAGGTTTITLTTHIPAGTAAGTTYSNTATVATTTADSNGVNDSSTTDLFVSSVDISVTKSGPATVTAGNTVTYPLSIANGGPDAALNVQLNDPLPANTTFVSLVQNTGPAAACLTPAVGANGTVNCSFPQLLNGESATFTLVIRAGNTLSILNTVTGTADDFDNNPGNNTASATTAVTPSADVGVTKSGPATVTAGANFTYTVTATNAGPSSAANVSLTDTLPANTTFVSLNQIVGPVFSCSTPAVGSTGTIACTIATFVPGASTTFSIVLKLASSVASGGGIANTANIATTTADPVSGNNSATASGTTSASADLSVTKTGPISVTAGSTATYTVVVTNSGPSDAAAVSLTDTLPPNTTFLSETQTTGPVFACTTPVVGGTGTITCNIATLASGATATFSIVLNVSLAATGTITNTANLGTTTADPNGANNSSAAAAAVAPGTTPPPAPKIPTLTPLAFVLLGLTLALLAFLLLRTRRSF